MKGLKFLLILVLCASLFFGIFKASYAQKYPSPSQYSTIADYRKATGKDIKSFNEAPMLAELVKVGKLPPVDKRVPTEPLVVVPVEEIGQYGGTWRAALLGRADTAWLTRTVDYEGLLRWSPDFTTPIPNIAKSYRVTDEGRTFTFSLRKGMKWSDGQPFTADDILFWYEDVLMNKELTPTIPKWLTTDGQPVKVEKIDDYTVRFKFTQPNGLFTQRLATPDGLGLIIPKHYMKQFHIKYAPKEKLDALVKEKQLADWFSLFSNMNDSWMNPDRPVVNAWKVVIALGTGPRCVFERNPYYWKIDTVGNQLPYIDKVSYDIVDSVDVAVMKALNGEIDMQDRHIGAITNFPLFADKKNQEKGNFRLFYTIPTGMNTMVIAFNLNHKDPVLRKIFNEKRFRFAMSSAINRKEIIDLVYLGQGEPRQPSPLPESPFYHEQLSKAYIEYNPAMANKLLDEIGLKRGPDGIRLRPDGKPLAVTIEVATISQQWIDACELVKRYWEAVGVKTAIKTMDRSLFYSRKAAAEHDIAIWGGDGGMEVLLEPRWYFPFSAESNHAPLWQLWYNSGGKSGEEPPPEVKKQMQLYDEITKTTSFAKQKLLMKQILDISAKNLYVIGISSNPRGFGIVKNNFRNVPEEMFGSWLYPNPAPTNPCQYFIKK